MTQEEKIINKTNKIKNENTEEHWKEFMQYGKVYWVSDLGRMINPRGKLMTFSVSKTGYYKCFNTTLQRVVAYSFGLLPELKYDGVHDINFIDNNKNNVKLSNLRVLTHDKTLKRRDQLHATKHRSIDCFKHGKYYKTYYSIKQASEELQIYSSNICFVLKGKLNSTGGYTFRYTSIVK